MTTVASSLMETINPGTYIKRMLESKPIFQKPTLREFSSDDFIDRVAKQKHENNSEMKNLFKTSKHYLGSENDILNDYYNDIGTKNIMKAINTGGFIDQEKEQKHIDRLRNHYKQVSAAKKYQLIQTKGSNSKFTKDDFHNDGTLKASSKYNPMKNKNLTVGVGLMGVGGGFGGLLLRKGLRERTDKYVPASARLFTASLLGGLLTADALSSHQYAPTKKAVARRRAKLKDGDLLKMLRGENVVKEKIKVENHALG